jgi:hypothetical protein
VSWEIAAGYEGSEAPVEMCRHLRWLRVSGGRDAVLLAGLDTPYASCEIDGTVMSHGPRGIARYRLGLHSESDSPDLPWQFGWATTPMLTARTVPREGARLPTFGALFDVERVGIAVLGMAPASRGYGVVLFLQELLGVRRDVSIAPGLVRFGWAQPVDFLERPVGEPLELREGAAAIPIRGHGVVALELSGLELNLD